MKAHSSKNFETIFWNDSPLHCLLHYSWLRPLSGWCPHWDEQENAMWRSRRDFSVLLVDPKRDKSSTSASLRQRCAVVEGPLPSWSDKVFRYQYPNFSMSEDIPKKFSRTWYMNGLAKVYSEIVSHVISEYKNVTWLRKVSLRFECLFG